MTTETTLRVMVVGAGGHARVCLEALHDDDHHEVIGAVSRDGTGVEHLGVPMLGADRDLRNITQRAQATAAFVAIGHNATRAALADELGRVGLPLTTAISRFSAPSSTAALGAGTVLLAGSVVNAATTIGRGVIVNTNASVDHDCWIGNFAHIAPGVAIGGGCTIGDRAFVGIGARILPNLTIGADAVVGAGAVVVDDVPAGAVVVGVPARRLDRGGSR